MRKSGDRVRITAQLNDVTNGSHIWAERYDRDFADLFAVQDEITEAIVAAIEPQLYAAENFRARRKPPGNLDAWDLVMRALSHYWRVTRQDHAIAQDLLEKAIAIDPNYGQALGRAQRQLYVRRPYGLGRTGSRSHLTAERAALAAVRADSEDPWAHHALGAVYLITRRFDDSLAEFELALRLNPNFSQAQNYYGTALGFCGRWEEGAEAAMRAIRLSPRDPFAGALLRLGLPRPIYRTQLRGSDPAGAHRHSSAQRLRRRASRADRRHRNGGTRESRRRALQELRRAQPNISLAWVADHVPIQHDADREHYLEGFRRAGLR